jgi:hypothetical protein
MTFGSGLAAAAWTESGRQKQAISGSEAGQKCSGTVALVMAARMLESLVAEA